jgi:hypothetical protein
MALVDNPGGSNRITIIISDDLKRAIRLRVTLSGKTQTEVVHDALMFVFKPELEMLANMEKEAENDRGK